jgi:hypothetical protein
MLKRNFSYHLQKLPVVITKQGHQFVAYTPALDISTAGSSEKDVKKKFGELVTIFLEEIIEAGTVREVLTELGWTKTEKAWNPPEVVSTKTIGVQIPAFA